MRNEKCRKGKNEGDVIKMRKKKDRMNDLSSLPYRMGIAGTCIGGGIGIIDGPLGLAAGAAVGGALGKKTGDLISVFLSGNFES
jgi:hypothetical protein